MSTLYRLLLIFISMQPFFGVIFYWGQVVMGAACVLFLLCALCIKSFGLIASDDEEVEDF